MAYFFYIYTFLCLVILPTHPRSTPARMPSGAHIYVYIYGAPIHRWRSSLNIYGYSDTHVHTAYSSSFNACPYACRRSYVYIYIWRSYTYIWQSSISINTGAMRVTHVHAAPPPLVVRTSVHEQMLIYMYIYTRGLVLQSLYVALPSLSIYGCSARHTRTRRPLIHSSSFYARPYACTHLAHTPVYRQRSYICVCVCVWSRWAQPWPRPSPSNSSPLSPQPRPGSRWARPRPAVSTTASLSCTSICKRSVLGLLRGSR